MPQPTQPAAGGPRRSRAAAHSRFHPEIRTGDRPW